MGYVGPNGSGKTTTLNLITGILKCGSGEVYIDGHTCKEDVRGYREQIGYVGDESYFPENFTAKDIRRVLKDFYSTFSEEKFNGFLKKWDLPEKKPVKDYSRGMKVMLMFASVLSRETQIADYIYFIDGGRTVLHDAKDEMIESFLLVKGESGAIPPALRRELIGLEENAYGFEAILPSEKAELLGNAFLVEKPTIDNIVIHFIRNRETGNRM